MIGIDIEALRALLARVEAATGLDREIDLDLWNSLTGEHWEWVSPSDFLKISKHEIARQDHEVVRWLKSEGKIHEAMEMEFGPCPSDLRRPASLTSSLDAIVALVERVLPGWSFLWAWNGQRSIANVHIAPLGTDQRWASAGQAPTPALALCAALLRALVARAEAGEQT